MGNKKQKNTKLIKVGIASLAVVSGLGFVVGQDISVPAYAKAETKQTVLENKQVVNLETTWKYLDNNVDPANGDVSQATNWTKKDFIDTDWKSAKGKFGAKKGALADLGGGCTPDVLLKQYYEDAKDIPTYFFRTTFNVSDATQIKSLFGTLKADDGVVVYINGTKVIEQNMTNNGVVVAPNMFYAGTNGGAPAEIAINLGSDALAGLVVEGENTLAVELHNDRESSSDVYFSFEDLTVNYQEETIEQKAVSLMVGEQESENNLTWYANTSETGEVQVAKKGSAVEDAFPKEYQTYKATTKNTNDGSFYSNQVTIDKLQEKTQYVYRVVNGETVSETYTFTTGDYDGNFNFILAGDPQIGAGSLASDRSNWSNTLSQATTTFTPDFLISAGDQVNTASNETQYAGYLGAEGLTNLPTATTIGNHDSGSIAYQEHFNLPNEDSTKGATTAGGDYWYVYNNTLFMDINTNNKSVSEHKAFMEEAIKANPNIRWKTVVYHHSIYSTASHTSDPEIINLRNALPPIFEELKIDVVLQGHDHVYTRTYMMNGLVPDTSKGVQSSVTDPTGIVYLTANSASGSKYYDIKAPEAAFAAKMDQSKRRTITNVEVTDNSYTMTTYFMDDMSVLDTFTINKAPIVNDKEEVLVPNDASNSSVAVAVKAPAGTLEAGTSFQLQEQTSGETYTTVSSMIEELLGVKKDFKFLSLDLMKNDQVVSLHDEVEVIFDIPSGFNSANIKLYRYNAIMRNTALEEVTYHIQNNKLVIETAVLGDFIIVNNAPKDTGGTGSEQEPILPEGTPNVTPDVEQGRDTVTAPAVKNTSTTKPSTSDNSMLEGYAILLFTAIGCSTVVIKRKKENKE